MKPNIIYEDTQILVCQKAAGMAVQSRSLGQMDLESMIKNYLAGKSSANPYLGIIHRLDQPVQGLVVFAKEAKAAAHLSAQVQDGRMKKYYLAVTDGVPGKREDTLTDYLKKDGRTNRSEIVRAGVTGAKKASLSYRVREENGENALLEIELHTGRHHQIRVQMAGMGTPLFGDTKYNLQAQNGQGIALCAYHLELVHPKNGKKMEFFCEPQGSAFERFGS